MKRLIAFGIVLFVLVTTLTGCTGNGAMADSQVGGGSNTANTSGDEPDENTSEVRWAAVPAVFVNDTYFRLYTDELHHTIPDLDNTWVNLGVIKSAVQSWESPTQNFQTNNEAMVGAEVYFASGCCIPVTNSVWGDPIEEMVIGDAVIVVFENNRLLYISEDAHAEVMIVMDVAVRHSLMVDGVIYSLMATAGGGGFSPGDNHVYLGEVTSAVPMDEYPTENLQTNREAIVGAKVYRLPSGESSDIVVFFNEDTRFYFKHLPETFLDNSELENAEKVDLGCCISEIAVLDKALLGANSVTHASGDFVMTLNSDKHSYSTTDIIRIWGTLEYVGDDDSIEIWSSCPFMLFTIAGGDKFGSGMGGGTVDVLVTSVLERGRVYHFEYQKSGGWSGDDPNAEYWETFFREKDLTLPSGEYTIILIGDFGLSERVSESASGLSAELIIEITQ